MRRTPAGSNGSQEASGIAGDEDLRTLQNWYGDVSVAMDAGVNDPEDDDALLDEATSEQALLELMIALTRIEEGDLGAASSAYEDAIAQRITDREDEFRIAFAEHVRRLREGARSVAVCVFDFTKSESKRIQPPSTAYLVTCQHGAKVVHYRREVLADVSSLDGNETLEMRLEDIFTPAVCNTRLKWAGPTVQLVRTLATPHGARFMARLRVCDERPCAQDKLQVMLKCQEGAYAGAVLEPGCAESPLGGNTLPDSWDALLMGFAISDGDGKKNSGPSLYRRRVAARHPKGSNTPVKPTFNPNNDFGEGMATRVAEC